MSTPFVSVCPHCETKLKLKDPALIGRTARCPACHETFTVAKAGDAVRSKRPPSVTPAPTGHTPAKKSRPQPKTVSRPKPAPGDELDPWITEELDDLGNDADSLPRTSASSAPPPVQGVRKKRKPSPMSEQTSARTRRKKNEAVNADQISWVGWLVGGSIAGLIGAAVWGAIAAFTWHEAGIVAWGIGALVGFGVRIGAREDEVGLAPGLTALGIAVASVVLGKFLAVHFLLASIENMVQAAAEQGEQVGATEEETVEWIIAESADAIAAEREEQGQEISWPDWETLPEDASLKDEYPADLWAEAEQQWNAKSDEEKAVEIVAYNSRDFEFDPNGELEGEMFKASFGLLDLLWFFLAAGTAFKVGSGLEDDE